MANRQSHLKARFSLDDSMFQKGINNLGAGVSRAKGIIMGAGKAALGVAVAVGAAAASLSGPIAKAAAFEDAIVGFEQLLGGAEAARKRIEELTTFAATTPFELPGIIAASRTLETLTKGALSTGVGLRMVGDAAAATGQPIEELAVWFGRLYDGLASGRPVGEALMRLQELGLVSGDVRARIEKMQKTGKKGAEVWAVVAEAMGRFSGLMEKRSATWNGKMSNLGDAWGQLLTKIGGPIKDALTPYLDAAIAIIGAMVQQGEGFGQSLVEAGSMFTQYVTAWIGAFTSIPNFFAMAGAVWKVAILESIVLLKEGWTSVMGFVASAMDAVVGSGFLQMLAEGGKRFGDVMANATLSLIPRLWDGFKSLIAGLNAGFATVGQNIIELLFTGILKVVSWFGQGWSKAIWEPLKAFGQRLADMALSFGETIKNFLSFQWEKAKETANDLKGAGRPLITNDQGDVDIKGKVMDFMKGFRAQSFGQNFEQGKAALDAVDPLKDMFDRMQAKGDAALPKAIAKLKEFGATNLIDPLIKFFHADKGIEGARDAAWEDLRNVIKSLSPVGKQAVADAIGGMFGGAGGPKGSSGAKDGIFSGKGMEWKTGPWGFNGKDPRNGGIFNTPAVHRGLIESSSGLTSGGLTTGSLINPKIAKEDALAKKKSEEEKNKPAKEETQVAIKNALEALLSTTKDTWTKN